MQLLKEMLRHEKIAYHMLSLHITAQFIALHNTHYLKLFMVLTSHTVGFISFAYVSHCFREANRVADILANEGVYHHVTPRKKKGFHFKQIFVGRAEERNV